MKLKIAICANSKSDKRLLTQFLLQYQFEYDTEYEISLFSSGEELLTAYKKPFAFDIVFLEIELNEGISGMDAGMAIRALPDYNTLLIYMAGSCKYMQNSFHSHPFQYMLKPLEYISFCTCMHQIMQYFYSTASAIILLNCNGEEEFVKLDDIACIEILNLPTAKNMLKLTTSEKEYQLRGTIKEWEKKLKNYYFVSPCRGVLINIRYARIIHPASIELTTGKEVRLSRRNESKIRSLFEKHILFTR